MCVSIKFGQGIKLTLITCGFNLTNFGKLNSDTRKIDVKFCVLLLWEIDEFESPFEYVEGPDLNSPTRAQERDANKPVPRLGLSTISTVFLFKRRGRLLTQNKK